MKVDLEKAFDCLDWVYLRLVIHKIGIQASVVEWIMACVSNVQSVVVINGYPRTFFKARRGLRQGYSLSPLLFILAMDGLSLHIKNAMSKGHFLTLHLGKNIHILHKFFVDDVLITGILNKFSWLHLFHIFTKFGNAFGLIMNHLKSTIVHDQSDMEVIAYIRRLFGVASEILSRGMKCLGFHIKPCNYKVNDWMWLVDRFYKNISHWEYRRLSMGGRITLTQAVTITLTQAVTMQMGVY